MNWSSLVKVKTPGTNPRGPLDVAGMVVVCLVLAGGLSAWHLDLSLSQLVPGEGGLALGLDFISHALKPVLQFEGDYKGAGQAPVLIQALEAAATTLAYAAATISLSVVGGLFLGLFASTRISGGLFSRGVRNLLILMRAIHELVWAVILLAALGREPVIAVFAMAIPYTGTFAKIFAEMLDEADPQSSTALVNLGATSWQSNFFGLMPEVGPDILAYGFYRFECALRSSAVLGFFGFPTLGYFIAASFENLFYGEVWTYLYVLFALVVLVDWWSGRLRKEALA
jgi:ABC-type phosphate/phosphonate transport system permease subunit